MSNSKSKNHKRFDDEMDMEKERVMQKHNKQNVRSTNNTSTNVGAESIAKTTKVVYEPKVKVVTPVIVEKEEQPPVKQKNRIQFDEETGLLILRVSNNTLPTKLAGAIIKHFKDGAKGMVIISIGSNALNIAIKSVAVSQNYLLNETDKKFLNKQVAIVPKFYEFVNENGNVNTVKLIVNLI